MWHFQNTRTQSAVSCLHQRNSTQKAKELWNLKAVLLSSFIFIPSNLYAMLPLLFSYNYRTTLKSHVFNWLTNRIYVNNGWNLL